jgi:hypothetical protein
MKAEGKVNEPLEMALTYEELKTYKGFENLTEEEAEIHIYTIKKLAKILYCMYLYDEQKKGKE